MSPLVLGALVAIFVGIVAAAALVVLPQGGQRQRDRVQAIENYVARSRGAAPSRETSTLTANLVDIGERVMSKRDDTDKVMALLQRADLPLRPGEWAIVRVISLIIGLALCLAFMHDGLLAIVGLIAGLALGGLMPGLVLKFLAKRRCQKFERQMPDVLMLVASSLSTGFSLMQALDAVATDVAEPARKEFARVMAEARIGAQVEDSLDRLAERMDSDNMRWTSMAIAIQRQVGGNLAETLRKTAQTLRDRESLRRQVRALSAEGRLSAYILLAMPVALFLFLMQTNREYISLLWSNVIGWGMMIGCAVNMTIGTLWMNKVVKVEV